MNILDALIIGWCYKKLKVNQVVSTLTLSSIKIPYPKDLNFKVCDISKLLLSSWNSSRGFSYTRVGKKKKPIYCQGPNSASIKRDIAKACPSNMSNGYG